MNHYEPFSSQQDSDIDLKPFINFLVVLIPVLMISAEFSKIAIVEASAYKEGSTVGPEAVPSANAASQKLGLTLFVSDSTMTLGSNSAFLPTIRYREYHTYVANDNRTVRVSVAYDARHSKVTVMNPHTGKPFGPDERESIELYVVGEDRKIVNCLYTKNGGMVTNETGTALRAVVSGAKVCVVGPCRTSVTVDRPADLQLRQLSAYDDLRNRLLQVRPTADGRPDGRCITIAAQPSVVYDKIIQLMDIARETGFADISIAKVRG